VRAPNYNGYIHACVSGSELVSLAVREQIMKAVRNFTRELPLGFKAKRLRISQRLTQGELASMAGVSQEDVELFEHNQPVPLDSRRKILKELWAKKAGK
jgi:DNA-binding XRE family transcriptional regulator